MKLQTGVANLLNEVAASVDGTQKPDLPSSNTLIRFASPVNRSGDLIQQIGNPRLQLHSSLLFTIPEAASSVAFSKKRYHVHSSELS